MNNNFGGFNGLNGFNANSGRIAYYDPRLSQGIQPQITYPNQYDTGQRGANTNMEWIQGGEVAVNAI